MEKNVNLYTLSLSSARAWLISAAFVAGGLVLPQLCHLVPGGGLVLLPIYFFTLVAAYKYGLWVGLVTAAAVPLTNHLLFGMPPEGMLAVILVKGGLLALAAALAARWNGKVSLLAITCVVVSYQLIGSTAEWLISGDPAATLQGLRLGLPGLALQIFGGWALLSAIRRA